MAKTHKSTEVILWCKKNIKKLKFKNTKKTNYALCFDEKHKIGNAVDSYRQYYRVDKKRIATWKKRPKPQWFY